MDPGILDAAAVGQILGRCRKDGKSLRATTVLAYLTESTIPTGRYRDNPFPRPTARLGNSPYWTNDRIPEIEAWAKSRPGQGVGGGRPKKAPVIS